MDTTLMYSLQHSSYSSRIYLVLQSCSLVVQSCSLVVQSCSIQ